MNYLLGLIGLLGGAFFWANGRRKTAEAINDNVEVKTEIQKAQAQIDVHSATIQAEDAKEKEIQDAAKQEKDKPVGDADVVDFFKRLK